MIFYGYLLGALYAFFCLGISLVAYKCGMPKRYSRKLTHVLVGAEWIILSHFFGASYHFLIVCLFFTALLLLAHFLKLFPMISSDDSNAPGTVYYGVAMSLMAFACLFIPSLMTPFGIGVMCTSLGDGAAGIVGQSIKKRNPALYRGKTLLGTLANFVFSFLSAYVISIVYMLPLSPLECVLIGVFSVGLELITPAGLDNISITLGTSYLAYALVYFDVIGAFVLPIVFTPIIIALTLSKKVLTKPGLLLALLLDLFVSLTLGNFGFTVLSAFLIFSVLVDKVKKKCAQPDTVTKKEGTRDAVQVLANGLIPLMMAVLYSGTQNFAFLVGYVASLAEAFADTSASSVGWLSTRAFDIFRGKEVKRGLSGGMSPIGTLAALFASVIFALLPLIFGIKSLAVFLIIAFSAFLGTVFDSLLGSLLQVKYKCRVCGEITERELHCKKRTEKVSGFEFFDNDVVNLLSGLFSAVISSVAFMIVF